MVNLIACTENCLHQKDGFCSLEKGFYVTSKIHNGCHYYVNEKNKEAQITNKTEK